MLVLQAPCGLVWCTASWNSCKIQGTDINRKKRRSLIAVAASSSDWAANIFPREVPATKSTSKKYLNSVSDFTRFFDKGEQGAELQTAIVTYYSRTEFPWSLFQTGIQVDLVAAVHIADKEYFSMTQRILDDYDCVLYEMVAEKGKTKGKGQVTRRWKPPSQEDRKKRKRGFSFISSVQRLMAKVLTLDFQLECMDYRRDNWYHADLDFETFKELQRRKGESLFSFAAELTKISSSAISAAASARTDLDEWRRSLLWFSRVFPLPLAGIFLIEGVCAPPDAPLMSSPELRALFNLDFVAAMKLFLAKQLTSGISEGAFALVKDSVIIGERNRVAMKELETAIQEGCEKIAIFYGSGHLPDMDSRLRSMGFTPEKIKWQTAWSIRGKDRDVNRGDHLEAVAKLTGWPLNRYQTTFLVLFSFVLAIDLWFWEVCLGTLQESAYQVVQIISSFLDIGWNL